MIVRNFVLLVVLLFTPTLSQAIEFDDCTFLRNGDSFQYGAEYTGVISLQRLLNRDSDTIVSTTGLGASGSETYYYGPATQDALKRFQNKYRAEILYPQQLTEPTGYLGRSTRAKLISLYCAKPEATTPVVPAMKLKVAPPITGKQLTPIMPTSFPLPVALPTEFQPNTSNESFFDYNVGLRDKDLIESLYHSSSTHEGVPYGVPLSYDWAERPVIHAGLNIPQDYTHIIPWGIIYKERNSNAGPSLVSIRNTRLFLCDARTQSWFMLREGSIDGAVFEPDFAGNINTEPKLLEKNGDEADVIFSTEKVFHFWTERESIGTDQLCGLIMLSEARQDPGSRKVQTPLLFSFGADYWLSHSSPWNNYTTNAGVGTGKFRYLTSSWRWYGFSIANEDSLKLLRENGFTIRD